MSRKAIAFFCSGIAGGLLAACASVAQPSVVAVSTTTPLARATQPPAATAGVTQSPTPLPSATPTAAPSQTPTATPTVDATQAGETTIEAIALSVTASGVPEGSIQFYAAVDATRCAVLPPPTATPLPWALQPNGQATYSANCLGSDLPGQTAPVWLDGRWVEAANYAFANPADLRAAQAAYEIYLDLIGFKNAPPAADFDASLGQATWSLNESPSPQSCLPSQVSSAVAILLAQGDYVRLTLPNRITWDEKYYLAPLSDPPQATLYWQATGVRQALVKAATGQALRESGLATMAGAARMAYDSASGRWRVADDSSGYYCDEFTHFVR